VLFLTYGERPLQNLQVGPQILALNVGAILLYHFNENDATPTVDLCQLPF